MSITNLTLYRNKAYLELCLEMVETAYEDLQQGNYDLAASELQDILDTFDAANTDSSEQNNDCHKSCLIDFPR